MEEETVPEEETIPAEEDFSEDKIPSVSWQNAEQAVRNLNGGTKATFNTPYGNRVDDSFNKVGQIAREVKYGYQGLSLRLKIEILKDQFLLGQNTFNKVEWHFYRSVVSNTVGASKNLLKALDNAGIQHITHK